MDAASLFGVDSVIIVTAMSGTELAPGDGDEEQLFGLKIVGDDYASQAATSTLLVFSAAELETVCVRTIELLTRYGRGEVLRDRFESRVRGWQDGALP